MGRRMATRTDGVRSASLASTPSSVTAARHLVRDDLIGRDLPACVVEDALVVVTELMGNAVRHARPLPVNAVPGVIRLRWRAAPTSVRIDVTDGGGRDRPHVERPSLADLGGRGLAIVSAVATDWGVRRSRGQVTVYAVVGG